MAKNGQRNSREKKKPKQVKVMETGPVDPFAKQLAGGPKKG